MGKSDKPAGWKKPPRSTRPDDIRRELQKSTDFPHRHVDEAMLKRKARMREVLHHGTEGEFLKALSDTDINIDSERGKELIAAFRRLRGLV
jgi:hypothetical protein